jgi:NADH-quinone oxidoreductase subunit N
LSGTQLLAMAPLWIVAGASIFILISITVKRSFLFVAAFSLGASAAAFVSLFWVGRFAPLSIASFLIIDDFVLFYIGLLIGASFLIFLLASGYFNSFPGHREEFFLLTFLALLGAAVLAASTNFASLFLGLEILSVSLYALISYPAVQKASLESGIKYLVLGSAAAAFLLFGIALIYFETGSLDFAKFGAELARGRTTPVFLLGISLLLVGLGFKLGVVPFHLWTPDVYQGAPSPVTALISSVSKGGTFAVLFRLFLALDISRYPSLLLAFTLISAASMLAGNLLALLQSNVKRLLAYSSIAHFGYLLVAFLAGRGDGGEAAAFYLLAYFITIIAAFGVVTVLSVWDKESESLSDYRGLFWRRPWIAAVFTVALLSLAGIPATAGFLGKFYVAAAGIRSSLWFLVIFLIMNSALSLFYYLRVIVTMYLPARPEGREREVRGPLSIPLLTSGIALTVLVLLLFWFGIFPSGIIGVIRRAAGALDYSSIAAALKGGFR